MSVVESFPSKEDQVNNSHLLGRDKLAPNVKGQKLLLLENAVVSEAVHQNGLLLAPALPS